MRTPFLLLLRVVCPSYWHPCPQLLYFFIALVDTRSIASFNNSDVSTPVLPLPYENGNVWNHPLVDMSAFDSSRVYSPVDVARIHDDVRLAVNVVIMICDRIVSKYIRISIDLSSSGRFHSHVVVTDLRIGTTFDFVDLFGVNPYLSIRYDLTPSSSYLAAITSWQSSALICRT